MGSRPVLSVDSGEGGLPVGVVVLWTTVVVNLTDAPQVTGRASYSGKDRTIRPIRAEVRFGDGDSGVARVMLRGPQVRATGALTASHYDVHFDVRDDASQWLRSLVEAVR